MRQPFTIEAACISHVGRVRSNNEDNFYFDGQNLDLNRNEMNEPLTMTVTGDAPICVAVFDGMGGEAYGEDASYTAASVWKEAAWSADAQDWSETLHELCLRANRHIYRMARKRNAGMMGSTAVSVVFAGETAHFLNIGDSKLFLYRNGELHQLSEDHTDERFLREQGIKRKARLTQHLGIEPEEMVIEPQIATLRLEDGDRWLLCSDGLTDMVSKDVIAQELCCGKDSREVVERLLEEALQQGGKDNITIILCSIRHTA